ncbi:transposase [Methylocapsa aurea]|uniref:transposase n=1 Tax=Methylocapsa aurea TaxID=663610 RepID=UPI003D188997
MVAESADPAAIISEVARRNGVSRGLLTVWRRRAREASHGARCCAGADRGPRVRLRRRPSGDRGGWCR